MFEIGMLKQTWYYGIRKRIILPWNLVAGKEVTDQFGGIIMKLNLDDWIQQQIYFLGIYEAEKTETHFWENVVKDNDVIFDIGANIGYYAILASPIVGKSGLIYCFEPSNAIFHRMVENFDLNKVRNTQNIKMGLSNEVTKSTFYLGNKENWGMGSLTPNDASSGETEIINVMSLDKFVLANNLYKIDVIKIDVEGSEFKILQGAMSTLSIYQPVVLIEVSNVLLKTNDASADDIYTSFQSIGFDAYEIVSDISLRKLQTHKEGNLIVFMHPSKIEGLKKQGLIFLA